MSQFLESNQAHRGSTKSKCQDRNPGQANWTKKAWLAWKGKGPRKPPKTEESL